MYHVDKSKTFSSRDEYERKNTANNIYKSIQNSSFYSPCLLDGQWGSGKTEFCHKLYNYIVGENSIKTSEDNSQKFILTPIYINVFNAERINNPFLTLMGGLVGSLSNDKTLPNELTKIASNILTTEVALQPIIAATAKDAFNFFLSRVKKYAPSLTEEIVKQISEGIDGDLSNGTFEDAFKKVNELDSDYLQFSTELKKFSTAKYPILFIVDELDRCRPDFAIQFLECIKHFFNVENVYFLLSCNVNQLLASIEHLYGSKIHSENYLEKFFKDKMTLKNDPANIKANLSILTNNQGQLSFLKEINMPSYIEYIFATTTLRQQENIIKKYQQIQSNSLSVLVNRLGSTNLAHLIIFSISYSIIINKITTLQEFQSSRIFERTEHNYNHNMNSQSLFSSTNNHFSQSFSLSKQYIEGIFNIYT